MLENFYFLIAINIWFVHVLPKASSFHGYRIIKGRLIALIMQEAFSKAGKNAERNNVCVVEIILSTVSL